MGMHGMTEDELLGYLTDFIEQEKINARELIEAQEWKYVLGLDPGGTTGVALLRYKDNTEVEVVFLHQIAGGTKRYADWFKDTEIFRNVHVASECWVEHNVRGADRTPFQIEGVQYAQWGDDPNSITYQEPRMKQLITDDFLKENNLWVKGKRHQMDALIHALVWLREQEHQLIIRALDPEQPTEPLAPGEGEEGEISGKQLDEKGSQDFGDALAKIAQGEDLTESEEGEGEGESDEGSGDSDSNAEGHESEPKPEKKVEVLEVDPNADSGGTGPAPHVDAEEVVLTDEPEEPTGERRKKYINGVFIGYASVEEDQEVVVLHND